MSTTDGQNRTDEEVVLTAIKRNSTSMMRMERLKKQDINFKKIHHIAGGPYKGILVNKQADDLVTVDPPEGRVEFMAFLMNAQYSDEEAKDRWTLRFWFRGQSDGLTKKKTFTDYFSELISPGNLPRKYVYFVKQALVLLKKYTLIKRLELEVEEIDEKAEELPPIKSFVSVFTPDSYTYRFVPEHNVGTKCFLTFKLKAKSNANVALCAVYGDVTQKTYEIALGAEDNTKSFIRDGSLGAVKSEAKTVSLLDDKEFRYFWVSWADHHVEVGRGAIYGNATFLSWKVPENRQFVVHSMAVSTSRSSKGEWEFAEILDEKELSGMNKRHELKLSLLWLAKKQKMLNVLENAYPNSVHISTLFKASLVKQSDTIKAVVNLKDMEKKNLIYEVEQGIWIKLQSKEEVPEHDVKIVKELPAIASKDQPEIAIVTSLYEEKVAVDAMIEDKKTFVIQKTDGDGTVYTFGKIGKHNVVCTKIPVVGDTEKDFVAAENTVTHMLETFKQVHHGLVVGVGGAVPHYTDHKEHVRLGDVVVSVPQDETGASYVYCSKVEKIRNTSGFSYVTRIFSPKDQTLITAVKKMKRQVEVHRPATSPWDSAIEAGKDTLHGQESNFHRPMIQRDKLFRRHADGTKTLVDHPRPAGYLSQTSKEGETQVSYGVIGCGQRVSCTDPLRSDFAQMNGVKAFQKEQDIVLESMENCNCDSFLVILGMCDYEDGSKHEWRCFAALAAAAYMKSLLLQL